MPRANIAPLAGRASLRLAGERIATPACALVRNDRPEGAAYFLGGARVPGSGRRGYDPALRYRLWQCLRPNAHAPVMHP